jgi:hypothetical protein
MRTSTRALGIALVLGAAAWALDRRRPGARGQLAQAVTDAGGRALELAGGGRQEHFTDPAVGVHNPIADDAPRQHLGVPLAPPPVETPGPSVTPPKVPWSETEREEWADARRPDAEVLDTKDPFEQLIAEEESAAAAEARAIGGFVPRDAVKPEMNPVYQAGEGDLDGWEQAERELRENASHGDGDGNPLRDMYSPEAESDRSSAVYGDADEEYSSEVLRDPSEGPEDPGAGPGLPQDR